MQCPSRKTLTQQAETPRTDTWAAIAAHRYTPRDTADMQQSPVPPEETECGEKVTDITDAPQQTDETMNIDKTLIVPRTDGEPKDTVLPQTEVIDKYNGKGRDPHPFDPTLQPPLDISHVSSGAGASRKGSQKPRREDRTHTQDVPHPRDDADQQMEASQDSPKKSRKLRTNRGVSSSREKTRSRTRATLPHTQVQR